MSDDNGEGFPVQPLRDMMVVEMVAFDEKSLLVMPDSAKSRLGTSYGRVIAVGPGLIHPVTAERIKVDVEVGNVVMHREYSGSPFKHGGKPYLLLMMDDTVAVVDEESFDPNTYVGSSRAAGTALPGLGNEKLIIPKP